MVMWVCEASEVNIWTVFAVRPNGPKITEVIQAVYGGYTRTRTSSRGSDKIYSGSGECQFYINFPLVWTENTECALFGTRFLLQGGVWLLVVGLCQSVPAKCELISLCPLLLDPICN